MCLTYIFKYVAIIFSYLDINPPLYLHFMYSLLHFLNLFIPLFIHLLLILAVLILHKLSLPLAFREASDA